MVAASTFGTTGRWAGWRLILAYAAGASILLMAAGALNVLDSRGWDETLIALSPRKYQPQEVEPFKEKIREAIFVLPATFARIGVALLGVAVLGSLGRWLEDSGEDATLTTLEPRGEVTRFVRLPAMDLLVSVALAALVFVQVAAVLRLPLHGDELENYRCHLKLPLKGVLTSMQGANNQLGYSVLAWTSMRVLGDSPFTVRLPALLGAMLLTAVAYRVGSRRFGRGAALLAGLLLALWPDCLSAAVQGRSYSLLMVVSILHFHAFEQFVSAPNRRRGFRFALSLAAACTLHMWFVVVVAAELVFLIFLKADDRLGTAIVGYRSPLRTGAFLRVVTLGGLGALAVQAGILHKFVFILTQKNPTQVDTGLVLSCMANCLKGNSFDYIELPYHGELSRQIVRSVVALFLLVGLGSATVEARRNPAARFEIAFFTLLFVISFLVTYIQKPVYLYARFFIFLPMLLIWAGARGWGLLLSRRLGRVAAHAWPRTVGSP
jgi:hypothetical protein